MWIELLIFLAVISVFFYRWATHNHDFFVKRNVAHDKHVFFFGGGLDVTMRKKSVVGHQCDVYNRYDGSVYGSFDNRDPILYLRDPELIKTILIKDFDHFVNRRNFFDTNDANLFTRSLLFMQNEDWREMRSTLSPAFTGKKMRQMFELMLKSIDEAMVYLQENREKQQKVVDNSREGFELDVKDWTTRLTTDIIASSAFGLQVNSFHDKENEFYTKAKTIMSTTVWSQMRLMCLLLTPKLAKFFKIDMFSKEYTEYFTRLVLDTMKYRQDNNIQRPDMINLLMEARGMLPTPEAHRRDWSDLEVVAQCFLFFFAAQEPLSLTMSFAVHELMEYPEVQQKLYEEIQKVSGELQGNPISYESLQQKMPYMDMVVAEVLRKWPVVLAVDRTCTQDFAHETASGERVVIRKGDIVRAAMCAIHRDPKYFENPDVLNPERFSEENKSQIDTGTYLPFGLGPRNCIGNRFALLVLKAFLFYFIRDYRLEASPQSCVPMELEKTNMRLRPTTGFWVQCIARK